MGDAWRPAPVGALGSGSGVGRCLKRRGLGWDGLADVRAGELGCPEVLDPGPTPLPFLEGREFETVSGDVARARRLSVLAGAIAMIVVSAIEGAVAFPALSLSALAACLVTGAHRIRAPRVFLAHAALAIGTFIGTGLLIGALSALQAWVGS